MKSFFHLNTENRIFGLDILRFFAIMFVMITHTDVFLPEVYMKYYTNIIYDGVGIFFVLSGFLIGGILLKQMDVKEFTFKELLIFWYKRWSRTLPNYYLFLFVLLLTPFYNIEFNKLYSYFLFLQNIFSPGPDFFGWSWSLSVEEWFYLLIPLMIYVLINIFRVSYKQSFLITLSSVIIGGILLRIQNYRGGEFDFYIAKYTVIHRLDAIMYGMLGAYLYRYHFSFWERSKWVGLGIGFLGLYLYYFTNIEQNIFYRNVFSFNMTSLTVLCFLPYLSGVRESHSVWQKPITYISLISYSMYLVNSLVSDVLVYSFDWNYWVENYVKSWAVAKAINFILFWVISTALSFLIYKYFEVPTTQYLRRKIDKK